MKESYLWNIHDHKQAKAASFIGRTHPREHSHGCVARESEGTKFRFGSVEDMKRHAEASAVVL